MGLEILENEEAATAVDIWLNGEKHTLEIVPAYLDGKETYVTRGAHILDIKEILFPVAIIHDDNLVEPTLKAFKLLLEHAVQAKWSRLPFRILRNFFSLPAMKLNFVLEDSACGNYIELKTEKLSGTDGSLFNPI